MTAQTRTPVSTFALPLTTLAMLASSAPALAGGNQRAGEIITVTTLEDVTDFAMPQQVANLPGPDGVVSFHEAVYAANTTSGPQSIHFAIPQSEWWLIPNIALLRQEVGIFGLYDNDTTIDFSTQTAFTGDTNPDGARSAFTASSRTRWALRRSGSLLGDRAHHRRRYARRTSMTMAQSTLMI